MSSIQNLICLDEVYFGKTPEVVAMEEQLRIVRHKYYKNQKADPNGDPDLIKFNRMVEDFFGFGCFGLTIVLDPIPSTLSIPIDYSFSAARRSNNFSVNEKTYKFKKEFDYACIICMTSGLFSNPYFTTGEVMSCILYELGHNFYSCMEKNNGILSGIYSATLWASAIQSAVQNFSDAKMISSILIKSNNDGANITLANIANQIRQANPNFNSQDPEVRAKAERDLQKLIKNRSKIFQVGNAATDFSSKAIPAAMLIHNIYDNSIDYMNAVKDFRKEASENNNFKQTMYIWSDYLGCALSYLGNAFSIARTAIGRMLLSGEAMNASSIIKNLTGEIFLPYKTLIDNAKNPLTWIMLPLGYRGERGAENFPTMYGYAPEAISYANKFKSLKANKATRSIVKSAPFIGIMYDIVGAPAKILNGVFDNKPDGISMSYDQIRLLKRELRKQKFDPKVRETLENDLDLCEKNLKKLTDISRGVEDPDFCKHLYNKLLGDIADGMGLKERILDNRNKFRNYDKQFKLKHESAVEDWMVIDEGVSDIAKKITTEAELRKQWNEVAKKFVKHHWITRHINESQRAMLDKYYKMLTDDDTSYQDYQKGFRAICKFMGLNYKEVIIEHLLFQHDSKDPDQPIVALNYSRGLAKVTLPEGIRLVHISPADNIQALQPSFRSKVKGKYMYPSKRIFFTIKKDINPTKAGIQHTKTYRYTPTAEIKTAYIDPTYADYGSGFVYVETNSPIPVQKWDRLMDKIFAKFNKKDNKANKTTPVKEECEYDYFEESVLTDFLGNLKQWKTSNQAHSKKVFKNNSLTDKEYDKLSELIDIMTHEEDYSEYKKAFDKFCRFCHIVPRGTIITKYDLKKGKEDEHSIYVEYSENTKKIQIPSDLALFHLSSVKGIKELKPFFRGKSQKGYLYDKPRIYLTVNDKMPKVLADYKVTDNVHKYKVKSSIKSAYVDPLVWLNVQGALYIETNDPVPVEEINAKPQYIEDETSKHDQSKFADSDMSSITRNRVGYSQTTQSHKSNSDLDKAAKKESTIIEDWMVT